VYVISDGKEYGSDAKYNDVKKYLQTNNISVYATLVHSLPSIPGTGFLDRLHLPFTMRDDILPLYANATGGQIDPEYRTGGIETSFAKLAEQVRTQYTVGYISHEPVLDGKFRPIQVRVLRPNLTVIAEPGYYPTARQNRAPLPASKPATPSPAP
jgi:VWFA-related protein